jgi:hypothetical protein
MTNNDFAGVEELIPSSSRVARIHAKSSHFFLHLGLLRPFFLHIILRRLAMGAFR